MSLGLIAAYFGEELPLVTTIGGTSWLFCNGQEISRADYSALYHKIGDLFGAGDKVTTFNLPDLRGYFVRGIDTTKAGTSGNDPDGATRTIGNMQQAGYLDHIHPLSNSQSIWGTYNEVNVLAGDPGGGDSSVAYSLLPAGGNETRPKNAYVNFIIAVQEGSQADVALPAGAIVNYVLADGDEVIWLTCDGALTSRGDPNTPLFTAIGSVFGDGDGVTTYYLPDLRGTFLRGVDDGVGRDPDAGTRTAMAAGGNVGDAVGSVQSTAITTHEHVFLYTWGLQLGQSGRYPIHAKIAQIDDSSMSPNPTLNGYDPPGSAESRPTNMALGCVIHAGGSTALFPVGAIIAYGGNQDPGETPGGDVWLVCDGRALQRKAYSDFFLQSRDCLGPGDGTTTFNIPDLRGRFLRGMDWAGLGRDPDASARAPMFAKGRGGYIVGSCQQDEFQSHIHGLTPWWSLQHDGGSSTQSPAPSGEAPPLGSTDPFGGAETRPVNAYVNFIIKVKGPPAD